MAEEPVRKQSLLALCVEFTVVLAVGLSILAFFLCGEAFHRGFYCDDESLRHPYKSSTVPSYYLYIFGFGLNFIAMLLGEYLARESNARVSVGGWNVPKWSFQVYKTFITFCFGAACSQLITDSLKYTIGRLRPHFYTLCAPVFKDGQTCEKLKVTHFHEYITDFTCGNIKNMSPRQLKEMRLSFPSGHSSFAMFTMLYLALYIGARYKRTNYNVLKHLVQYAAVLGALLVGMSRVSDYKHHWSDVVGGLTIGSVAALVTAIFVAQLFDDRKKFDKTENNRNGNNSIV